MRYLLLTLLLAGAANAAEPPRSDAPPKKDLKPCSEISKIEPIKFEKDGRGIVVDRSLWKVLFCDAKGMADKVVDFPPVEMGQTTIDQNNGFVSAAYQVEEDGPKKMYVWDSQGKELAHLDIVALNAVIWVDDGVVKAGSPDDGVVTIDVERRRISRTKAAPVHAAKKAKKKAKAAARDDAIEDGSSRP